jgi:3alpha(or 20beta)-hydroxysteroid dehydrogenase
MAYRQFNDHDASSRSSSQKTPGKKARTRRGASGEADRTRFMSDVTSSPPLQGTVAIVTGGGRGIGEATARRLVGDGARVVIGDIRDDLGSAVARSLGRAARYVHLDVTSQDDWRQVVEFTRETFGNPGVLVCNAGIMISSPFEKTSPDDFRRAFETNAMGSVLGIQAVLDPMRDNGGGSIVIVSSVAGQQGVEGLSAYCTSKAANTMIARCAAIEFAQYNIRVNSIHPSKVDTAMSNSDAVASAVGSSGTSDLPPLGRIAESADVAALVAFLASDDAAFITGGQHVVDGGRQAGYKYSKTTAQGPRR